MKDSLCFNRKIKSISIWLIRYPNATNTYSGKRKLTQCMEEHYCSCNICCHHWTCTSFCFSNKLFSWLPMLWEVDITYQKYGIDSTCNKINSQVLISSTGDTRQHLCTSPFLERTVIWWWILDFAGSSAGCDISKPSLSTIVKYLQELIDS